MICRGHPAKVWKEKLDAMVEDYLDSVTLADLLEGPGGG